MFSNIKDSFSNCEDCGKSLFWEANRWSHPKKPGKLLCTSCHAKYSEYIRKEYFKALDKAMTNVINRCYDSVTGDYD